MTVPAGAPLPKRLRKLAGQLRDLSGNMPRTIHGLASWLVRAAVVCQDGEPYLVDRRQGEPTPVEEQCIQAARANLATVFGCWEPQVTRFIALVQRYPDRTVPFRDGRRRFIALVEAGEGIRSPRLRQELEGLQQVLLHTRARPAARPQPNVKARGLTRAANEPIPLPRLMPPVPSAPKRVIPLAEPARFSAWAKCGVCKAKLLDLVCVACHRHVCPRCGSCSVTCEARNRRREMAQFPAFRESRVGFVPEEEWIARKRAMKEGVGRTLDFEP